MSGVNPLPLIGRAGGRRMLCCSVSWPACLTKRNASHSLWKTLEDHYLLIYPHPQRSEQNESNPDICWTEVELQPLSSRFYENCAESSQCQVSYVICLRGTWSLSLAQWKYVFIYTFWMNLPDFLKKKKKNTSQNVVFLLQTQTEKKIDFHIHFCQHPTFSNQVTAIYSNIIWLYMIHCNIIMMLSSSCICLFSYLLLMSAAYLLQLLRQHLVFVSQLLQLIRLTVGDKHKKVWPILSLCLQSVYFYFNIINTYIKAISAF